ncbi:NADPH:adrenodoxin oxidoreductase mitochondrial precursor [Karstenula rhodostoma CBS 690.94]|uniref:NADPH:adrenodoxin oxidoreductase, mitochondrial n=1 Tax=Karstenula rhodostoma CBS 690.94 TaxID=1392251 RepID=A0A9P4UII5_9PLEO|nr:NADPH:adrenodoxin oxidoreductase mitochondrial precursor [Karstenula rhodostoma CBS 690.94]
MNAIAHARRAPYVCASCIRRLHHAAPRTARTYTSNKTNGSFPVAAARSPRFALKAPARAVHLLRNGYSTASEKPKPLRLAIIGSGPAGFYTAHRLMKQVQDVVVDMYEKLPVPYGLVRFGVAPDHPEVKNCQDTFEEVAASPRFNYIGNVEIGKTLALADMKPHYDAILFAYGASEDRKLGIPGEDLPGVYSAREFVGWYNGHPQFAHLKPELDSGERAVVIGHGNVALDVARILVAPLAQLRKTDIAEHAVAALARSKIKRVEVVGRRGPLQASYTVKEARELMQFQKVGFKSTSLRNLYPENTKTLPRVQQRLADVLLKGSTVSKQEHKKRWELSFMKSPHAIHVKKNRLNEPIGDHVHSIEFQKTRFVPGADPLSKDARVELDDEIVTSEASIVFRSIGYKSTPLPGLSDLGVPFDQKLGIIPNDAHGRIISPSEGPGNLSAGHLPGLYAVGWVKRGPTGVIVSTMMDAFTTADVIVEDWSASSPFLNGEKGRSTSTGLGWDGVKDNVLAQGVKPVDWEAWKRIDKAERERGKEKGKVRLKFVDEEEMKAAAGLA